MNRQQLENHLTLNGWFPASSGDYFNLEKGDIHVYRAIRCRNKYDSIVRHIDSCRTGRVTPWEAIPTSLLYEMYDYMVREGLL